MFKAKKLLKGSSIAIFENLTTRRASLLKDVKRIAGNRKAWTTDGNILTFDMEGKILLRGELRIFARPNQIVFKITLFVAAF